MPEETKMSICGVCGGELCERPTGFPTSVCCNCGLQYDGSAVVQGDKTIVGQLKELKDQNESLRREMRESGVKHQQQLLELQKEIEELKKRFEPRRSADMPGPYELRSLPKK